MRLKILPKKGDKRDLNNWRGVMLTDTQYRIVAMMADARLGRIARGCWIQQQRAILPLLSGSCDPSHPTHSRRDLSCDPRRVGQSGTKIRCVRPPGGPAPPQKLTALLIHLPGAPRLLHSLRKPPRGDPFRRISPQITRPKCFCRFYSPRRP